MNANRNYSKYSGTIQILFTIQIRSANIQIQQYEKWMSTQGALHFFACNGGRLLFPLLQFFGMNSRRRFRDYIKRILTLRRYYISQDLWQADETKNIRPDCAPMLA